MSERAGRAWFALAILPVAAVAWRSYFLVEADGAWHTLDDPVITLRVAHVMAEHGVPHFNPGEAVAANTSLFWPILLAPLYLVVEDTGTAMLVAALLSMAMWIGISAWTAAELRDLGSRLAALIFLALGPWALRYGASTWEHVPQTVCMTVGLVLYLRGADTARGLLWAFWAIALSFVFRPDSAALIGCFWLVALLTLDGGAERRRFVLGSLPALAIPAAYLAGMWLAYGSLVPNTYHLKVEDGATAIGTGIAYLLNGRLSAPVPPMIALLLVATPVLERRERIVVALALVHLVYVVTAGGDIYPLGRFFLMLLPVLTLILLRLVTRRLTAFTSLAAAAAMAIWPMAHTGFRLSTEDYVLRMASLMQIAQILREVVRPHEGSVGLHHLGIGYHLPEHHIVDFLGKADPVIAQMPAKGGRIGHNKWDYGYSLSSYDVLAAPIPAASHEKATGPDAAEIDPQTLDWALAAQAFLATGRYVYVGPERFCFVSNQGFYLDRALAPRLEALEREGPDGRRCLP